MYVIRTYEDEFALHKLVKLPIVEGVKFRCDKCENWFEQLYGITRIVQKGKHLAFWPSRNGEYCKDCVNEVWHYEVLGNKRESK